MLSEDDWMMLDLLKKSGSAGIGYHAGHARLVSMGWAEIFEGDDWPTKMRITPAGRKALED